MNHQRAPWAGRGPRGPRGPAGSGGGGAPYEPPDFPERVVIGYGKQDYWTATTIRTVGGLPNPSPSGGTATGSGWAADGNGDTRYFIAFSLAMAGIINAATSQHHSTLRLKPVLRCHIITGSSIANMRYGVGWHNGTLGGDRTNDIAMMFRYSTGVPDINWMFHVATGSAYTESDTGVAVAADTAYSFEVDCSDGATAIAKINGTTVATVASGLPAATDPLKMYAGIRSNDGAPRVIKVGMPFLVAQDAF